MKLLPHLTHVVLACASLAFGSFAMAGEEHADEHEHGHTHAHHHDHVEADAAIGEPGVAAKVNRTIEVTMSDAMRYTPADIKVKKGETIRFVVTNTGKVRHEMNLDYQKELMEHLELMKKFPDMVHDEPNKLSLEPGKQGEIIWKFTKPGVVNFACLMPGHYEAGMKGQVSVSGK
jgi:uncharacterized cupredoxin-like copper-binding protein